MKKSETGVIRFVKGAAPTFSSNSGGGDFDIRRH